MSRRIRWLLLLGAVAGALFGVGLDVAVTTADGSVRPWLVIGVAAAGGVVAAATYEVWVAVTPADTEPAGAERTFASDQSRGGLGQAHWRLDKALREPDRFETTVRVPLREIAVHRLLVRHGVDSGRDPDRARALMGDELWLMVTDPEHVRPELRTVRTWVTAIERL